MKLKSNMKKKIVRNNKKTTIITGTLGTGILQLYDYLV